jgi:chromosome segregation ATPase
LEEQNEKYEDNSSMIVR